MFETSSLEYRVISSLYFWFENSRSYATRSMEECKTELETRDFSIELSILTKYANSVEVKEDFFIKNTRTYILLKKFLPIIEGDLLLSMTSPIKYIRDYSNNINKVKECLHQIDSRIKNQE